MNALSPVMACLLGWASVASATAQTHVVSDLAGAPGVRGNLDGTRTQARFTYSESGTLDGRGNLYLVEYGTIRRITPSGEVTTIAGVPGVYGHEDGSGRSARFSRYEFPIAADAAGNIYAVDPENHTVRKITAWGEVTTLAGSPRSRGYIEGTAGSARFSGPSGIAVDRQGWIYVSDTGNRAIRRISPAGEVTTFVSRVDGAPEHYHFNHPTGLAFDGSGNLYVADSDSTTGNSTITRVTPTRDVTATRWGVLGSGSIYSESSGIRFKVDGRGSLYVLQADDGVFRWITPEGVETARLPPWPAMGAQIPGHVPLSTVGLLAVDDAGTVFLHEDGVIRKRAPAVRELSIPSWSLTTYEQQPWTSGLAGVAYGNGTFVLAGSEDFYPADLEPLVYTSPDGTTWTRRSVPAVGAAFPPRFVNGRFFIGVRTSASSVGSRTEAAGDTLILSSTDGVRWISSGFIYEQKSPVNAPMDYAYGNGLYVAVGNAFFSSTVILTSSDGVRWTHRTIGDGGDFFSIHSVAFFKGRFYVTLYFQGRPDSTLYSSADGATWTRVENAPDNPRNLAASATSLLLSAFDGPTPRLMLSTDGVTFTALPPEAGNFSHPIRFHDGVFLTADTGSDLDRTSTPISIRASYDGRTWSTVGLVTSNKSYVQDFEQGNGRYVFLTNLTAISGASYIPPGGAPAVPPAVARLNNFSIRAHAGAGAETLTVGVTFGDTGAGGTKRLLVRGVGPTLAQFGVTEALADPRLDWLGGTAIVATNNDWNGNRDVELAAAAVGAFALPANSKDAALIAADVRPGSYTLQLTGANGGAGGALVEIYDLSPPANATATDPRLRNFSARAQTGAGGDALIAGFVVTGERTRLLIRAVGPSLSQFGGSGFLPDPQISLFRDSALIATNDNWDANSIPTSLQVGAGTFPLVTGSRDAALLVELEAGSYTVTVQGADGLAGQALLEIIEAAAPAGAPPGTLTVREFTIYVEGKPGNWDYFPELRLAETSGRSACTVRSLTYRIIANAVSSPVPTEILNARIEAGGEMEMYVLKEPRWYSEFYLTDSREATAIFVEIAYTDASGREGICTAAARIIR